MIEFFSQLHRIVYLRNSGVEGGRSANVKREQVGALWDHVGTGNR